jgi:hypothetical protein
MSRPHSPRLVLALLGALVVASALFAANTSGWRTYKNCTFDVTLKYPQDWKRVAGYNYSYAGKKGFFQLSAVSAGSRKIEDVAKSEAQQKLSPYGSTPTISEIKVDGQDARLVMPSKDQAKEMKGQAAVIVRMPEPTCIGCERYNYIVLYADKDHIKSIAGTLRFIKPTEGTGKC